MLTYVSIHLCFIGLHIYDGVYMHRRTRCRLPGSRASPLLRSSLGRCHIIYTREELYICLLMYLSIFVLYVYIFTMVYVCTVRTRCRRPGSHASHLFKVL